LTAGEGQPGTGVTAVEDSIVGGEAIQRRYLQRGREPSGGRAHLSGGAHQSQAGQAAFVREEEVEWGEAGLHSQDVDGSARKAVGGLSLDIVPEHRQLPRHVSRRLAGVSAVAEDRK